MFDNLFQQGMPANNSFAQTQQPTGFVQNNGLNFGNVAQPKVSTSTPEEMALIRSNKKSNFSVSDEEMAVYAWDLREGTNLAIEIVDPSEEKVRVKYTGEEFNIVMQPVEVLNEFLKGVNNFVFTAKITDTSSPKEEQKELWRAWGIVKKLLPQAYLNGQKNYQQLSNMMTNQMASQGYQGTWGNGMFNGSIGAVANYVVPDGSTMGMFQGNQPMMNGVNPQLIQQMAAQMAQQMIQNASQNNNNTINGGVGNTFGYNNTPMQTGGTMLNPNPFVQNGQPQQPMMNNGVPNINSIPMPGTPIQPQQPNVNPVNTTSTTVKI